MRLAQFRRDRSLHAWNFTCIASGGFGDEQNNRAQSMAWFQDRLYVGISRHKTRSRENEDGGRSLRRYSVDAGNESDFRGRHLQQRRGMGYRDNYVDQQAQIWRYDPRTDEWQKVFVSPLVKMPDGSTVARDPGYRRMAVFQGASDPAPALYVSTLSTLGSLILRSQDGENFVPVTQPQLEVSDIWSFRTLTPFAGRLFTSPAGIVGPEVILRNASDVPVVLSNVDPIAASWQRASPIGFGDPTNKAVYEMTSFNGFLYAGTFNATKGFQLWKTQAQGEPPYHWIPVITDGAFRGSVNQAVASMSIFAGSLYIGTGNQGSSHQSGSSAAELIRIHRDDSWELIIGEPRHTFEGARVPLSGLGPGFDNEHNTVIWSLVEHEGWLYAGTENESSIRAGVFELFLNAKGLHRRRGIRFDSWAHEGGFMLWRSPDGVTWELVTESGFGNPNSFGLERMISTPVGLFIGTVALPRAIAGYPGGCEIWWGR